MSLRGELEAVEARVEARASAKESSRPEGAGTTGGAATPQDEHWRAANGFTAWQRKQIQVEFTGLS